MFDLKVVNNVAVINERNNGKSLKLNRVVVNDGYEQWDLAYWREGKRLGGVLMMDAELEDLKKILCDL